MRTCTYKTLAAAFFLHLLTQYPDFVCCLALLLFELWVKVAKRQGYWNSSHSKKSQICPLQYDTFISWYCLTAHVPTYSLSLIWYYLLVGIPLSHRSAFCAAQKYWHEEGKVYTHMCILETRLLNFRDTYVPVDLHCNALSILHCVVLVSRRTCSKSPHQGPTSFLALWLRLVMFGIEIKRFESGAECAMLSNHWILIALSMGWISQLYEYFLSLWSNFLWILFFVQFFCGLATGVHCPMPQ